MKKFSRALAVTTVAFVGSASATGCPDFVKAAGCGLQKNSFLITGTLIADQKLDKKDHITKAFVGTTSLYLHSAMVDQKTMTAQTFAHRFAADLGIRKASDMIGLDGLRDAALKKCDVVLPEGMIRDNVKPIIDGAAKFITHPETLTELAMMFVLPSVMKALGGGNTSS